MKIKILLVTLLVIVFLVGCAPVDKGLPVQEKTDISMELAAKHGSVEVWTFLYELPNYNYRCFVAINTLDSSTPTITCP